MDFHDVFLTIRPQLRLFLPNTLNHDIGGEKERENKRGREGEGDFTSR